MLVKFFACSCRGDDEGPSASSNQFLNGHRIVRSRKISCRTGRRVFGRFASPIWSRGRRAGPRLSSAAKSTIGSFCPRAEFTVFAKLRSVRKLLADRQGVPAYALFTNEQLAAMVQRRVVDANVSARDRRA